MNTGFDRLDDVVRCSFPEKHCRLLAVREHGDFAVALFDTRPTAEPYLYEVHYQRRNGRWSEGGSSNGSAESFAEVTAFHINGQWVPVPRTWQPFENRDS